MSSCSLKFYLSRFWVLCTLLRRQLAFALSRCLRLLSSQGNKLHFQVVVVCEFRPQICVIINFMNSQGRLLFPQFVCPSLRAKAEISTNPITNFWGPAHFPPNPLKMYTIIILALSQGKWDLWLELTTRFCLQCHLPTPPTHKIKIQTLG